MTPAALADALDELEESIERIRDRLPSLAEQRQALGVTKAAVARAWPRSEPYVGRVEKLARPTANTRAAYLAALSKAVNE